MGREGYHNTGFLFVCFGFGEGDFIESLPQFASERLFGLLRWALRITAENGGYAFVDFRSPHVADGTAIPDFRHGAAHEA
jgi:hypothetical protein